MPMGRCPVTGDQQTELTGHTGGVLAVAALPGPDGRTLLTAVLVVGDLIKHVGWIEQTNAGDTVIGMIDEMRYQLAERHTQTPPAQILTDVLRQHRQVLALLRGGKQRLRQTRELFRIDADLLAHASILLGDLYDDGSAVVYGMAAVLSAQEAGASEAAALSVQAKTERWRQCRCRPNTACPRSPTTWFAWTRS
ncbi:hypothetical protein ACIBQX_19125 [Nonomuraea sp. NPDC049714]|uniref:hypothetical protein n=1 Tax=Nonomuraea sp. NPDC049714 TaxID=3364357 RepID=UPI0037A63460